MAAPGAVTSYNIAPGESTDAAAIRRKLALAMMGQGMDTSPIQHWTQGASRVAQAVMGGLELRREDERDQADRAKTRNIIGALMGGSTMPSAPATTAPVNPTAPRNVPAANTAPGRIYSSDEPSPLDPPSGNDRDLAIRTILAEAGNQGYTGQQAVASVIRNRAVSGQYGGDTPGGVVTARNQFEPWNTHAGRQRMASIDPNSPQYQQAASALESAYAGNDPTRGATHFYAPKAQAQLAPVDGRPVVPPWAAGKPAQDIGDHRFVGGAQGAVGAPVDQPRGGVTPDRRAQLIQALSQTKAGAPYAQAMVMQQLQKEQNMARPLSEQEKGIYPGAVAIKSTGEPIFPPPSTNVALNANNSAETTYSKGKAEQALKLEESNNKAIGERQRVEMFKGLVNQFETGKLAPAQATVGAWGQALGIDPKTLAKLGVPENAPVTGQLIEAMSNEMTLSKIGGEGGMPANNFSNTDRDFLVKAGPNLANTPGANKIMLEVKSRVLDRELERGAMWDEYRANGKSFEVFERDWRKKVKEGPNLFDDIPDMVKQLSGTQPAGAPDSAAIEQEMRRRGLLK